MKKGKPLRRGTPLTRAPFQKIVRDTTAAHSAPRGRRHRDDGPWRAEVLRERGAWCRVCGGTRDVQVDHLIPRSQGGESVVQNGLPLGGSFGCGHHDEKTAHRLLIERDWLDPTQVTWLENEGHARWDPVTGIVSGRHCRLFADITTRRNQ